MVAAKALPLLVDPLLVATRPGTTSSLVKFIAFSVTESLRFAKDEAFKRKPVVDPFVVSNGNLPLSAIVALALGAQSELTRTNLLASLNEDEDEEPPTVLPWDWERMLQVSGLAFARDTGGQTVQRVIEAAAEKSSLSDAKLDALVMQVPKYAKAHFNATRADCGSKLVASCATAKAIVLSPVPFAVRALSQFLADVALDAARWACGTLDKATLRQNATIKAYRYAATGGLQYVCACLLPFAFAAPVPPLPFLFIVTDLVGAFAAEAVVRGSPV